MSVQRRQTLLTLTYPADAVEDVARLTFTAIRAQQVDATVTDASVLSAFTFVDICKGGDVRPVNQATHLSSRVALLQVRAFHGRTNTSCAILVEVISSATVHRGLLADVGASCVDTDLPSVAWARLTDAFIDVLKQKQIHILFSLKFGFIFFFFL